MNKSESKYFHTAVKFDRALLALLEKKPFDYITVSELCAEAGVNRSTFYLHYENTQDLLPYLAYIRDNRHVFSAVLSHPSTFRFEDIFQKLFDDIFNPIMERFRYPAQDRKYVLMFYLNGLTAIVQEWLKDGCQKSLEEVSGLIRLCIFGKEW